MDISAITPVEWATLALLAPIAILALRILFPVVSPILLYTASLGIAAHGAFWLLG